MLSRKLRITSVIAFFVALAFSSHASDPVSVYPIRSGENSLSLNGTWDFFHKPVTSTETPAEITNAPWSKIKVPGHWELEGFAEPRYKTPDEGTGFYRRTFRLPMNWSPAGQRIFLRFEGVLYGLDVWINGQHAGTWGSAFNPVTFDITPFLHRTPDTENEITVRVTTRNKGWEFDTNDCWGISGIYRDVFIFATPAAHIQNYTARTTLNPDGSATLAIAVTTTARDAKFAGTLYSPDGKIAGEFSSDTNATAEIQIARPKLWTAETPSLYTLEIALREKNKTAPTQILAEQIGLRQITIDGAVLKLNGTPIKLRGVDHHDMWPDVGRAATESHIRADLELMRRANINFIRTSHYPPHPRLIELCDEMGFYVMCEVPFGFGDKHLTDPSYQDILLTRARATIERDQNRPSVIVWSIGNENPITDIQLATGREVKRLDPTRPICFPTVGSYFEKNYEKFPDFVDIYAPHYPSVKTLEKFAATLKRPVIVTEYAHALGLATERVSALWEIMRASPNIAGGAIWMFQDQGLLRTGSLDDKKLAAEPYVWPDATHYYDTGGIDGMDGLVYSDRTPQTDYYEVQKVYSPINISHYDLVPNPEKPAVSLHIENRFDFRSLAGIQFTWDVQMNGRLITQGTLPLRAPAKKIEVLEIPLGEFLPFPESVTILNLQCRDETGILVYQRSLKLAMPRTTSLIGNLEAKLQPASKPALEKTAEIIRITHPDFTMITNRATGETTLTDAVGRKLVEGIYPHTGRRFTEADKTRLARNPGTLVWSETSLTKATDIQTDATETSEGISLTVQGAYQGTHGTFSGNYTLLIRPNGTVSVTYAYTPNGKSLLLEAGLSLVMPNAATEYRWIGLGPLASSPGKETASEYGRFHLTRGDLNFSGNRRQTELALITRPDGPGIAMGAKENADIAVEDSSTGITLNHNAVIASRGNKGAAPEHELPIDKLNKISGSFIIIPLSTEWPAPLTRWFGQADTRLKPFAPFLRSYDQ